MSVRVPTATPPAVCAEDRVCDVCDERPVARVLALDRPLAVCHSCATGLQRDGIDLVDVEESTEPTAPAPAIGPHSFCKSSLSAAERAALLRARKTLKRPQNGAQEIAG